MISEFKAQIWRAFIWLRDAVTWVVLSLLTGGLCGGAGVLFHFALDFAGEGFAKYGWLMYLLPVAGVIIVLLYRALKMSLAMGTDSVLESARGDEALPWQMAPLIFAGTFLTHLTGGSAGREGAALQMGASLSCIISRLFKLDRDRRHIVELSGMSALFSALFGTPVAAAFFAIEVVEVGRIRYKALMPCMVSSLIAAFISRLAGVKPTRFEIAQGLMGSGALDYIKIGLLAILCALVAILFCKTMHICGAGAKKLIKNEYLRVICAGAIIVVLSLILNTRDYNGAGMNAIIRALNGEAMPVAWLIKLAFTAITLAGGFRGGEIVPSFFVGACFGCFAGGLLGINPCLSAALGMVSVFCGVTNAPAASILIAVEMFSGRYFVPFALCAAISFFVSGKISLYHSQKYLESKYVWEE